MAAITSTTSGGNFSATTTWVGGVVPTINDNWTVVSTATVTWDIVSGTTGGDVIGTGAGTDGGGVINGTFKVDLSASRTMIMRGTLTVGATGFLDISNNGARIANSIKFDLVLNDSAALVTGKHTFRVKPGGRVRIMGAQRTRNATLVSAAAATATSITVTDATGWAAGDIIVLSATGTASTQTDERIISGTPVKMVATTGLWCLR